MADLALDVASQLWLPPVSIGQQFLLVVEQLLVVDSCIFVVGAFNDRIDRACFLAVSAVNAFGHVDIVAGGPTGSIRSRLALNGDSSSRAGSSAQFAGNTPLLASSITPQSMLASESW